jgi:hypothetical protein
MKAGDKFTISGLGLSASGIIVMRKRADNKPPPFWGVSAKGKRLKAVNLAEYVAKNG